MILNPRNQTEFTECWVLSQLFHSPLSLSSRGSLGSSSLSVISGMSSAYLRLLIFFMAILITACASSSPAFLMMYSAYKLNKQGDNIQPWSTPFPIWNQSIVPCPVLTAALWPAYRFSKRQVWNFHLFKNFPQFFVIPALKVFGVIKIAKVDVFSGTLLLFQWSSGLF